MGLKPRAPRTTSDVQRVVAAFADIRVTGRSTEKDLLRQRVEAFLTAPATEQAGRWHAISVLLEDGQGGLYPAAAKAAPLLLQLAGVPSTPMREVILPFLVFLPLAYQKDWLNSGCHRGQGAARTWFAREKRNHAIYQRLLEGLDVFLAALDDSEPSVRAAAACALAWFGEEAARIRAAVLTALEREEEPRARASLLLCLGLLGKYLESEADAEAIARHLDSDQQNVRIAAAYALMYLPGAPYQDRVFAEVRRAHTTVPWPAFPWKIFREPWFDFGRDRLLRFVDSRRAEVVETLFEIMEAVDIEPPPSRGPKPQRPCHMAAVELRKLVFPAGYAGLEPGKLSPEQQRFLRCYLSSLDRFDRGDIAGVADLDDLRELVAMPRERSRSPLLCELTAAGETGPLSTLWDSHGKTGKPAATALCAAVVESLGPDEVVRALIDGARYDSLPTQRIVARTSETGEPTAWPADFPVVPGGTPAADGHPGVNSASTVLSYPLSPNLLLARYESACAEAGFRVRGRDSAANRNHGWVHTERDEQRVTLYWTRQEERTQLTVSRAWHLATLLAEACARRCGRDFCSALEHQAAALVQDGEAKATGPRCVLAAATVTCRQLAIEPPELFDQLAIHLQGCGNQPRKRILAISEYLALLPEPRREKLVLALLERDRELGESAAYARDCPTPRVIALVLELGRTRGFAHHLAAAGPAIVPGALDQALDLANPRRMVFATTLSMLGQPATGALLRLLDDQDKNIRQIAERGLADARVEEIEETVRTLLADAKKARRELGARLLLPLPPSTLRSAIAADALVTEKTSSVRGLLERARE